MSHWPLGIRLTRLVPLPSLPSSSNENPALRGRSRILRTSRLSNSLAPNEVRRPAVFQSRAICRSETPESTSRAALATAAILVGMAGARMMRMRQLLVGQVVSHLAQQPDELVCGHGSWYPQKPFSFATTWMAARDDRAVVVGGWKRLEVALHGTAR